MEAIAKHPFNQPLPLGGLAGRVQAVLANLAVAIPSARIGVVEGIDEGFPGAQIRLPNGLDVVVGVDVDLPDALFEVVRVYEPEEVPKLTFEAHSANGWAETSKLSAEAVLDVVREYANLSAAALASLGGISLIAA